MQKRLVTSEFLEVKRFASFLSELNFIYEELKTHWEMVEDGENRIKKCIDESLQLFDELLDTVPPNQVKSLKNAVEDYRVAFVPKISSSNQGVVMDKEQIKNLVNLAQEQCKFCIKTSEEAETCPVFQHCIGVVPPTSYESVSCPYSLAEWME